MARAFDVKFSRTFTGRFTSFEDATAWVVAKSAEVDGVTHSEIKYEWIDHSSLKFFASLTGWLQADYTETF